MQKNIGNILIGLVVLLGPQFVHAEVNSQADCDKALENVQKTNDLSQCPSIAVKYQFGKHTGAGECQVLYSQDTPQFFFTEINDGEEMIQDLCEKDQA